MHEQPVKKMRRDYILIALMLTMSLAAMDGTIVATAIPQIVGDLGGFSMFSWLFSIYLLLQTITIPVYGKLADIYGRKPILIFGIVVFVIGSATCGAAWNMYSLIAFRGRSEEHTSELQSRPQLVCRLLLEKKNIATL